MAPGGGTDLGYYQMDFPKAMDKQAREIVITLTKRAMASMDGRRTVRRRIGIDSVDHILGRFGHYRVFATYPEASGLSDQEASHLARSVTVVFERPIDVSELRHRLVRLRSVEHVRVPVDRFAFV